MDFYTRNPAPYWGVLVEILLDYLNAIFAAAFVCWTPAKANVSDCVFYFQEVGISTGLQVCKSNRKLLLSCNGSVWYETFGF